MKSPMHEKVARYMRPNAARCKCFDAVGCHCANGMRQPCSPALAFRAGHIRRMVVCDKRVAAAIEGIDQRMTSFGRVFSLRSIIWATWSSATVRGRPGRYASHGDLRSDPSRTVCAPCRQGAHAPRAAQRPPCSAPRTRQDHPAPIRQRARNLVPPNLCLEKRALGEFSRLEAMIIARTGVGHDARKARRFPASLRTR